MSELMKERRGKEEGRGGEGRTQTAHMLNKHCTTCILSGTKFKLRKASYASKQ
jgi:hypothetical protein